MTAIEDIAAERQRQITVEGWTAEHDDTHRSGEMADAAACYAMRPGARGTFTGSSPERLIWQRLWPWSKDWWKPKDRRRDLIRAAALIVAEIERLDRAAARKAA